MRPPPSRVVLSGALVTASVSEMLRMSPIEAVLARRFRCTASATFSRIHAC